MTRRLWFGVGAMLALFGALVVLLVVPRALAVQGAQPEWLLLPTGGRVRAADVVFYKCDETRSRIWLRGDPNEIEVPGKNIEAYLDAVFRPRVLGEP